MREANVGIIFVSLYVFKKSKTREMKKVWIIMVAVCSLLSVSGQAYGQSLKDLLNSSTVKDAVTS